MRQYVLQMPAGQQEMDQLCTRSERIYAAMALWGLRRISRIPVLASLGGIECKSESASLVLNPVAHCAKAKSPPNDSGGTKADEVSWPRWRLLATTPLRHHLH